jgi:signal transduction histidine kinase
MSHEIRTPMHGVLGMTELALDNPNPPETMACLADIQTSAASLLQVIDDILDLSRLEAGKLALEQRPFLIEDCLDRCVLVLQLKAREKSLSIDVSVDPVLYSPIIGDALRLQQILTNLIHNAIKFTDSGSIAVRASGITEGAEMALQIVVEDTGCGIPERKRLQIFEAFSQLDVSTTRRHGGLGLGLAISAQLAHLMGGSISAEGNPTGDSTFRLRLPWVPASGQAGRSAAAHA